MTKSTQNTKSSQSRNHGNSEQPTVKLQFNPERQPCPALPDIANITIITGEMTQLKHNKHI